MVGWEGFIIAFLVSYILTPKTLNMLAAGGLIKNNFNSITIPSTAGIIFSAVLAVTYFFLFLASQVSNEVFSFLGFISLISLAGLVDDIGGNRENSGFKGHLSFLIKEKQMTTGIWKAGLGGVVATLAAAASSVFWWDLIINSLLIALSTNIFNLLDVRPGRSVKVFLLSFLLVIAFLPSYTANILLFPLAGAVGAYAIYDVRGKAMMGDTGSNVIGMTIGLSIMAGGNMVTRIGVVIILVFLHIISEFYSFTQIIENNKILDLFDKMGRRD